MQESSWLTRLGAFVSILGAIVTVIGFFFPIILTYPAVDTRFPDPYPPILDGVALIRSLFSAQIPSFLLVLLVALLILLALITLGTTIPAVLPKANVSGVVSWIRTLAASISILVLLWFLGGVSLLNFHVGFGPGGIGATSPRFGPGFGIAFLLIGAVLSALGLGRLGIGAVVGACIGFIFLLTPLDFLAFIVGTITCILGTLVGAWMQRASLKKRLTASSS